MDLLSQWVIGKWEEFMKRMYTYGEELSKCSFGDKLLEVISNFYSIQAERAMGDLQLQNILYIHSSIRLRTFIQCFTYES